MGLAQPEAIEAVEFLRSTIEERISPQNFKDYGETETRDQFLNGEAVFLRNWPEFWVQANASGSPIRGKVAMIPMVHAPGSGYSSGACQGGWGLGIAKFTQHPEEALKAVKFFTSVAAQRKFVLEGGYVPSRRSLFIEPQVADKYSHYPKLLEVINNSVFRPPIPRYKEASKILEDNLSAALAGQMNIEEAMKAAANRTLKLLKSS